MLIYCDGNAVACAQYFISFREYEISIKQKLNKELTHLCVGISLL
jgi:hypothetical protein